MINLFSAGLEIQEFLEKNHISFCFIGGLALLSGGEIRITNDIDLAVLAGFGEEAKIVDILMSKFQPRITDARNFALQNRVLLLYSSNNSPLDISLSGLEYEEEMISRSSKVTIHPGYELRVCSPEDLVVMKAFANRPKDWQDIQGIILRRKNTLNTNYIFTKLKPLADLKENAGIIEKLTECFK